MDKFKKEKEEISNRLSAYGAGVIENIENKLIALILAVYEDAALVCDQFLDDCAEQCAFGIRERKKEFFNEEKHNAQLMASIAAIMDEE